MFNVVACWLVGLFVNLLVRVVKMLLSELHETWFLIWSWPRNKSLLLWVYYLLFIYSSF